MIYSELVALCLLLFHVRVRRGPSYIGVRLRCTSDGLGRHEQYMGREVGLGIGGLLCYSFVVPLRRTKHVRRSAPPTFPPPRRVCSHPKGRS
jgi:hypothetical protein